MRTTKTVNVKIINVPAATHRGYRWQWRSTDGTAMSRRAFDLFYECVEDARTRGHNVELAGPRGKIILTAERVA